MTDLQELSAWHEAEGCRFAEFMASDDPRELNRVRIHRETAEILRLLDRVRSECLIEYPSLANPAYEDGPALPTMLTIDGPPDLLRQFAERLGRG